MTPDIVEKAALVALLREPHVRWSEVTAEIVDRGNVHDVLDRRTSGQDPLFALGHVDDAVREAARLIHKWEGEGIGVHAFYEDTYPEQLRDVHEMPPLLFTRGTVVPDRRSVAVVGTRRASERGLEIAHSVATALAKSGITVVSGLALGIDTAAHEAALATGGRTAAVLGTGIREHYPSQNAQLQERIASSGLLMSQFWPDSPPTKKTFPMRNAVMSGYASATAVIEAPWKSGARIQARLALKHGRPVVMPRELLEHDWAREYSMLPGVHVVDSLAELLSVVECLVDDAMSGYEKLRSLANRVQI
ncbi:DNA-processing protein DprA [Phytoactinopolyspora alkaliphila]|uniref:DNA-processing protein DprA n=1 Tax=Phytoactinopolyspora alkaliphila TaxID=1783498 RepID=A0A6N9YLR3_9ACTN|nr:DNA-processing protein DprA [Phytoactinopolyspora alkaliphila]NED95857.1 DNA-processing protein DprA [Phytoactinopolyspora alkaliphila]